MKNFLIISLCLSLISIFPKLLLAQSPNPNIQLRQFQVTPYPRPPSPTGPGQPNPTSPGTPPESGEPPFNPVETPQSFCESLNVVAAFIFLPDKEQQDILNAYSANNTAEVIRLKKKAVKENSSRFGLIFPSPKFIANNKSEVLERLKSNQAAFSKINSAPKSALMGVLNQIKGALNDVISRGDPYQQIGLPGLNEKNIDVFSFYYAIYKMLDYAIQQHLQPLGQAGVVFSTVEQTVIALNQNGWPKLPYLTVNTNSVFIENRRELFEGYSVALDWNSGIRNLSCEPSQPNFVVSGSPYIYLYPASDIPVQVKIGREVTYSNPDYSLLSGFNVLANPSGTKLYYEFVKSQELSTRAKVTSTRLLGIVKGDKLKDYLFNNLLPRLNLTERELNDYQEDIRKQLSVYSLQFTENYQIILLQNQEVDNLIPLTITPKPDTLIRNMIIIKPTNLAPTYPFTLTPLPFRSGFTVVENGFMVE